MLRFNMSHSRGLVLLALTCGRELGIDVEYIRYDLKIWEIAARYFSPLEAATLRSLPINMQTEVFFAGWDRKEAYIKARGEGLSLALNQFSVSLTPVEPAVLLNTLRSARGRPLDSTGAEAWLWLRGRPGR